MSKASPVYAYLKRPSLVDYPGYLAGVFFTAGCNFRCPFCHNAQLIQGGQRGLGWDALRQACDGFCRQWVDAVVISGGEPTLHDGLVELVQLGKASGLRVKLDTNGSCPERLAAVLDQVDYVAMDVKCSLASYPDWIGFANVGAIAESVALLKAWGGAYELRTTIVESVHGDAEVAQLRELVRGARQYVLQPFLPRPDLPDPELAKQFRTRSERLHQLEQYFASAVEKVVVRGGG